MVASELEVTDKTVRNWCRRALEGLRSKLAPDEIRVDFVGRYLIEDSALDRLLQEKLGKSGNSET